MLTGALALDPVELFELTGVAVLVGAVLAAAVAGAVAADVAVGVVAVELAVGEVWDETTVPLPEYEVDEAAEAASLPGLLTALPDAALSLRPPRRRFLRRRRRTP